LGPTDALNACRDLAQIAWESSANAAATRLPTGVDAEFEFVVSTSEVPPERMSSDDHLSCLVHS
jgi:hypothetical protein